MKRAQEPTYAATCSPVRVERAATWPARVPAKAYLPVPMPRPPRRCVSASETQPVSTGITIRKRTACVLWARFRRVGDERAVDRRVRIGRPIDEGRCPK